MSTIPNSTVPDSTLPPEARTAAPARRPLSPYLILAVAALLHDVGHWLARMPQRGLVFVFFMLLLGWVSYHLTTPDHTLVGRYAGGVFVYALSLTDAYKWARVRTERWRWARAQAVGAQGAG